ncbi:syntaxin binding protein 1 [Malassezia psittaci]|uniref:Syntaxin binding protein 1 n=1 Tax=Malassezia psittaci TaxID=1821823 RepID=A0AAF0F7K7_9BASI|nr:syntaxin binding protein 1 [Malassezia psittaci]
MQLLSGVMRMFDILEQNVTKVENIEKRRDAQPEMEAAYLLCATTQNVDRLIRELAPKGDTPPQYAAAHVFFVDAVSDQLVDKLTKSQAAPRIKQLSDLFLNFTPTESQVFDLKRSSALFALYQPMQGPYAPGRDEALAMLQEELDISAQSLVNLCITLNENPIIRYHAPTPTPLGPLAEEAHQDSIDGAARIPPAKKTNEGLGSIEVGQHFTKQLAFRVQAALDEYTRDGQMLGEPGRPQSVLLITDRSMDLAAPFLHEFTYQAMINDLLTIEDGLKYKHTYTNAEGQPETTVAELNDQDEIYVAIRHLHIAEAIADLTRQFNVHMGEASEFSSKTSIDGMRDMLASLPHMQSTKEKLSLHLSLAQQCMDRFEKSKLTDQATVEQNSATGETAQGGKPRNLVEEMVPLLDDPQISNPDKVRIIALYIMFCDGVHDEDRKRLFQHARLGHGEMTTVNNLVNLGARIVRESSGSTLDVIFRKKRKQLKSRSSSFNYDVSRYQPLIRTMIEDHLTNRLDQSLFPYVRDAPSEQSATGSLSPRSMSSFSNSATDMASSMLQSAIFATGGKDSPLARVGRFDQSSGRSASVSGASGISSTSLRSAKPTWHQKGRSQSVVTLASDNSSRNNRAASMDQGSATAQRVLVFVAGGMSYSEARTAYEVSSRNHVDVYIGASQTFTPLKFMEALRVMGSSRQPPPSESYIAARRAAQAQLDARKKQTDANPKKLNKETLPPPVYPQTLSPQERYDLRYETQVEPEPSSKQPSTTSSAAASARKISDKIHPRSKNDTSQDLRQATPSAESETGVRPSSDRPSVPQRSKMRDMSKFKNPFSFRK